MKSFTQFAAEKGLGFFAFDRPEDMENLIEMYGDYRANETEPKNLYIVNRVDVSEEGDKITQVNIFYKLQDAEETVMDLKDKYRHSESFKAYQFYFEITNETGDLYYEI